MGYDITFHPIAAEELKTFIFDVVRDPKLADKRAALLSKDPAKQRRIRDIYGKMAGFRGEVLGGRYPFASTYSYATAAIAGFLHPYWYARGSCITFLCEEELAAGSAPGGGPFAGLLASLPALAPDAFKGMTDRGFISENYSGSGFIDNSKLPRLASLLGDDGNQGLVHKVFDESGLKALGHAIDYARANGTGLMEASDIVVPFTNGSCSDFDNLRADFMKTDGNHTNSRSPGSPSGPSGGLWSAIRRALKK